MIFFSTSISAAKSVRISSKHILLCSYLGFAEPSLGPATGNLKLPTVVSAKLLYADRSHQDESVLLLSYCC